MHSFFGYQQLKINPLFYEDNLKNKSKDINIVFLYGEMGIGKTTFIKYLINCFQKINKLKIIIIINVMSFCLKVWFENNSEI